MRKLEPGDFKKCNTCDRDLPMDCYHKHQRSKDGRRAKCKYCVAENTKEYYEKNRDAQLERTQSWKERNKDKFDAYQARFKTDLKEARKKVSDRYKKKYPERIAAAKKVNYLLWKGEIEKKTQCQLCGSTTEKLDAHHHDYSKPKEVIWLCKSCHGWVHKSREKRETICNRATA